MADAVKENQKKTDMNYHRYEDYLVSEKQFRNIFLKRVNLILSYHPRGGTCLEIGCSIGTMLDILEEKGCETWGVEPSGSADSAKSKGHRVIRDVFEKADLPNNYFDLVVMNHTLEHMDNPSEVLDKIHNLLKPKGLLFIDVPNFGSLGQKILGRHWPYLLPNEHKHQFTKDSLSELLQKAGFKIIHRESRSGLFEYANPFLELWQGLSGLKKRFFTDTLTFPYALIATLLNVGDSLSIVGEKY